MLSLEETRLLSAQNRRRFTPALPTGEWQAELKQGATWISRGLPVSAAAVLRAAQELHAELAEPIETAIGAAREARAARVAALEAELEQARKALAELEG